MTEEMTSDGLHACKDCQHSVIMSTSSSTSWNPDMAVCEVSKVIDYVNGIIRTMNSCYSERSNPDGCGKEGKNFKLKEKK